MRRALFVGALLAGALAAPAAEAEWRGRGHGWGNGHGWGPPPRAYHHPYHGQRHHRPQHGRGWSGGEAALGAIIGLGAGLVIGSILAAEPPPPIIAVPPPPPAAPGWGPAKDGWGWR